MLSFGSVPGSDRRSVGRIGAEGVIRHPGRQPDARRRSQHCTRDRAGCGDCSGVLRPSGRALRVPTGSNPPYEPADHCLKRFSRCHFKKCGCGRSDKRRGSRAQPDLVIIERMLSGSFVCRQPNISRLSARLIRPRSNIQCAVPERAIPLLTISAHFPTAPRQGNIPKVGKTHCVRAAQAKTTTVVMAAQPR